MTDATIGGAAPAAAPAAPAPAQGAAPTPAPSGQAAAASGQWFDGFHDDMKGYVQNKGWKDPGAAIESYRNLEKLIGVPQDQLVRLPKADAAPEEWGKVWDRLGRPQNPQGYDIPAGADGNTTFKDWAQGTFHELGLSKAAGETLVKKFAEFSQGQQTAAAESRSAAAQQEAVALKKEWGAAHDQNIQQARVAAQRLGFDAQTIDALESSMGFAKVMKLMHGLASKMGESQFASGEGRQGFGAMTPEAARNKIAALKADKEWGARYLAGDAKARSELEQLHIWAYGS